LRKNIIVGVLSFNLGDNKMSKFNLKNYKKINLDEHTEMRLKEQHSEAPDVINEAQLEKGRVPEKDVTIEALLEKNRTGGATEITEKRLDSDKSKFDNKYRNAETSKGNINKLEEQRLKNDPVENEKYEPASEVGKELRWWETKKSPDGLKVASSPSHIKKQAQSPAELDMDIEDPIAPEEAAVRNPGIVLEDDQDFDITDNSPSGLGDARSMTIVKQKVLTGKIPGIYIVLQYDTNDFDGDKTSIALAAMSAVLSKTPELAGLIQMEDFLIKEGMEDLRGEVVLRGIGEEFANIQFKDPSASTGLALASALNIIKESQSTKKN